jgi:hypothetical protein
VPTTLTYYSTPLSGYILRNPRPRVCSGKMLLFAEYARRPTMVVTFFTSQPSFSTITEMIAF